MTSLRFLIAIIAAAMVAGPAHVAVDAWSMIELHADAPLALDAHAQGDRRDRDRDQDSRQGPEQTERFTQSYKVGADGALDLQNIAGDVRVTTSRGNEILVEAIKRIRHRDTD